MTSSAGGGKCGSGALSAGFSKLGTIAFDGYDSGFGGVLSSVVIGGTASVLGGGKFENGAATGAFGYLYNYGALARIGQAALIFVQTGFSRLQVGLGNFLGTGWGQAAVGIAAGDVGLALPILKSSSGAIHLFQTAVENGTPLLRDGLIRGYKYDIDGITILVRRDFGQFSHGKPDHWNLQVMQGSKELSNIHYYMNNGLPSHAIDTRGVWNGGNVYNFSLVDQIPR